MVLCTCIYREAVYFSFVRDKRSPIDGVGYRCFLTTSVEGNTRIIGVRYVKTTKICKVVCSVRLSLFGL